MKKKLHDTAEAPRRAFLICLNTKDNREDAGKEIRGLAETLELDIAAVETVNIRQKHPKYGMGSGKAAELAEKAEQLEVDCIVFDMELTPSQQRNWEDLCNNKEDVKDSGTARNVISVIDRQELIIQIFAARAATREADLQVQLALMQYQLPRLTHKYIDLSRQRGGRFGTKGSGETKLETDRRQIETRINKLEKEIEQVAKQRLIQRKQREKQGMPVCAIVGYTNAGKSSLLNALTGAEAFVEDKLFATLDTTTRRFEPVPGKTVLLSDTVGFIRRLPHSLIKAFRSTLEEASHANLLIHVLDASDPNIKDCYATTVSVLSELGAAEIPVITVLNKIDKLKNKAEAENLMAAFNESSENECSLYKCIAISAKKGIGLDKLKKSIAERLSL